MNTFKKIITTPRPLFLLAAFGIGSILSANTASAAVTINSSAVNNLGSSGTPSINLTNLGATDWFVLNTSGGFNSPAVYDEKSGGAALAFSGSTQLFGGGSTDSFNATWTDGTNTPSFSGNIGLYEFTTNSSTQTFTASILAGQTSTISLFSLSWAPNGANLVVTDSSSNVLSTLPLPTGFDTRSSIVLNYTSNVADTLTFQYVFAGGTNQQLGVAAVALTTVPEPSTWVSLLVGSGLMFLVVRRTRKVV